MDNESVHQETNRVEVAPGVFLPERLAPYWPTLRRSELPVIRIEATPAANLPVTDSKFGGRPYIPAGHSNPVDTKGEPMMLLAQLNFGDMPRLKGYPNNGILQFFICASDDLYGLNLYYPTRQENFNVVFHKQVQTPDLTAPFWTFGMEPEGTYLPITAEHRLTFRLESEWVSPQDIRFEAFFGKEYYDFLEDAEADESFEAEFYAASKSSGHKMGGYAYFTQEDPRQRSEPAYADYILLLQVDSDDEHIMWGDVGVANFFIHPDDLTKRDFANVMYNWDCS